MVENIEYCDFLEDVDYSSTEIKSNRLYFDLTFNGEGYCIGVNCDVHAKIEHDSEVWDDPGEYPSNAGGYPLPSEYYEWFYVDSVSIPYESFSVFSVIDYDDETKKYIDFDPTNYFSESEIEELKNALYDFVNSTFEDECNSVVENWES